MIHSIYARNPEDVIATGPQAKLTSEQEGAGGKSFTIQPNRATFFAL
jgi:hypothetical protein